MSTFLSPAGSSNSVAVSAALYIYYVLANELVLSICQVLHTHRSRSQTEFAQSRSTEYRGIIDRTWMCIIWKADIDQRVIFWQFHHISHALRPPDLTLQDIAQFHNRRARHQNTKNNTWSATRLRTIQMITYAKYRSQ